MRIVFEKLENPFLTARLLLRLFGCKRAVVLPEDATGHSVLMVESEDDSNLAGRVKKVRAPIQCDVLGEDFPTILEMLKIPIKSKKAHVVTVQA